MRVLVVHNFYRSENASGENLSVVDEVAALRRLGWEVEMLSADSDVIVDGQLAMRSVAIRPIYSRPSVRRARDAITRFRPDVVLVENVFPLHSPWVIRTFTDAGIPVAAGVRSYRMWCSNSAMYRDGNVCTDCVGSLFNTPAIRHGCYQDSPVRTLPMAASLALHRPTFRRIGAFLAVSDYVGEQLAGVGFDPARIVVRPNFVDDPGPTASPSSGDFLFAGRLSDEKGVAAMLAGWQRSAVWERATLHVAGSGRLAGLVADQPDHLRVRALGLLPHHELMNVLSGVGALVVPSLWHEPFGRGVIEAAARSRPTLVTDRGGLSELVVDGLTGWVAQPDPDSIAEAFVRAADPSVQVAAGAAARERFLARYTREVSIGILDDTLRRLADRTFGAR